MGVNRPEDREYFRERYALAPSEAARGVERAVFGGNLGVNGYTTVAQARRLGDAASMDRTSLLLDLGSGRGWPGVFLASTTGCRAVLCDVPLDALRDARRRAADVQVEDRITAVAADGRALPFVADRFDAVVHTDVLCWIQDKLSVLRACQMVLKPGGVLAGYTIHLAPRLSPEQVARAVERGPSGVKADAPYPELHHAAGLRVVLAEDVTADFEATCRALLDTRSDREDELRGAEGGVCFQEEQDKKARLLAGINEGLLVRSLHLAMKA